mmetsp:Transcript_28805/g.97095  ORF Transcript_28805/g.97095 Transcript_28805/m.97095 type:complete len:224 (+) Transcript_28805:106-777(+)
MAGLSRRPGGLGRCLASCEAPAAAAARGLLAAGRVGGLGHRAGDEGALLVVAELVFELDAAVSAALGVGGLGAALAAQELGLGLGHLGACEVEALKHVGPRVLHQLVQDARLARARGARRGGGTQRGGGAELVLLEPQRELEVLVDGRRIARHARQPQEVVGEHHRRPPVSRGGCRGDAELGRMVDLWAAHGAAHVCDGAGVALLLRQHAPQRRLVPVRERLP